MKKVRPVKKNLFLIGSRHVGKSTILQKVLAAILSPKAGIITEPIFSGERISGYRMKACNGLNAVIAHEVMRQDDPNPVLQPDVEALDKIGSLVLAQAQRSGAIIYIDELNWLMDSALEFQRRILRCLNSAHPFLATLDSTPSGFIELLCARDDVKLYPVTVANRTFVWRSILSDLSAQTVPLIPFNKEMPEDLILN